jgi:hypothetical protein
MWRLWTSFRKVVSGRIADPVQSVNAVSRPEPRRWGPASGLPTIWELGDLDHWASCVERGREHGSSTRAISGSRLRYDPTRIGLGSITT